MKRKRTDKQIKDAMEQCANTIECGGCVYNDFPLCKRVLIADAFGLIEDLEKKVEEQEERIAIMSEGGIK